MLRHKNYVNIQKSLGVDVVDGKFKRKYLKCKNCIDNNTGLSCLNCNYTKLYEHEEKQTDVNLATSIIADYFLHKPNKILICSADSDFVPVIKLFTQIKADITIKFIIPQNAGNFAEIKDALALFYQTKHSDNHRLGIVKMNEVHLYKAQMKDKIDIDGNIITNPYL